MALQGHPLDLDNPLAYHKVMRAEHPLTFTEAGPAPDTSIVTVEIHVFADREARERWDEPVQQLAFEFGTPEVIDGNLIREAYLEAKRRPLWAGALDV